MKVTQTITTSVIVHRLRYSTREFSLYLENAHKQWNYPLLVYKTIIPDLF